MNYSDLLHLLFDESSGVVNLDAVLARTPEMPIEVARQFCSEHGRKYEFQIQYGHLNLNLISWKLENLRADELIAVTVFPRFRTWFDTVSERPKGFASQGWDCIDVRESVRSHWRERLTWSLPPVILCGDLLGSPDTLHLAEGHTRIGLLAGLVRIGVIEADSIHAVWLAQRATLPYP